MKTLKTNFINTVLFLTIVFSLASCSKKDDPIDPTQLANKTWVIEAVNMAGMDMTVQEILAEESAEFQMTLKMDSTITFTDHEGLNPKMGKWQFQENQTQFKVYGIDADKSDVNTIIKLTGTELWFWHMDGTDKMTMHYKLK